MSCPEISGHAIAVAAMVDHLPQHVEIIVLRGQATDQEENEGRSPTG